MPIRFKVQSEYNRNFKPVKSHNSAAFDPSMEQKAGSTGIKLGSPSHPTFGDCEPALQRKKRVAAPVTSLSSEFFDGSSPTPADEYILLGNNEKFSENIKYRNRNSNNLKNVGAFNFRDASPPKIQKMKMNTEPVAPSSDVKMKEGSKRKSETVTKVKKTKDQAPVVDTSKFKTPLKRPTNPSKRKVQIGEKAPTDTQDKPGQDYKIPPRPAGPPRLSEYQREFEWKKLTRPSPLLNADKTRTNNRTVPVIDTPAVRPAPEKPAQAPAEPIKPREGQEKPDKQPEQTKVQKARPVSEPNYGLKYKAGVAPPRPKVPLRLTEYQREFEWKKPYKQSPLLNADKEKETREPTTDTEKTSVRKQAEVESKKPGNNTFKTNMASNSKPKSSKIKSSKTEKGKMADSMKPTPEKPQPIPEPVSEGKNKVFVPKSSQKPKLPPKMSEYQLAFQWNNPFKLLIPANTNQNKASVGPDSVDIWLHDVMELRQRAQEYRNRSQGTHFSREHLVQLMAEQNDLWDVSPVSSLASDSQRSPLSDDAGDIPEQFAKEGWAKIVSPSEEDNAAQRPVKSMQREPSKEISKKLLSTFQQNGDKASNRPEPDLESERLTPSSTTRSSVVSMGNHKPKSDKPKQPVKQFKKGNKPVKTAWGEENKSNNNKVQQVEDKFDEEEGRIPTPTLRQRSQSEVVRRHHLDRTTPSVGGVILTSASTQNLACKSPENIASESSQDIASESAPTIASASEIDGPSRDFTVGENRSVPKRQQTLSAKKIFDITKLAESPTFGKPSYDSHVLRDDFATEDRPLITRYVVTPLRKSDSHLASDIPASHGEKPSPSFVPPTLWEGVGMTYSKPDQSNIKHLQKPISWSIEGGKFVPRCSHSADDDDDILSTSARSVASSSSLASQVLQRARKRQQNVWG
ncbi:nuclear protein MDM1-like isoform X2 [Liolophura sinensis]|uniref:nuclear protein MDM1-like isoform X2 n=1 Tax=Liolophura sinensis TaxID=3198878 RepID=UPI0031595A8C